MKPPLRLVTHLVALGIGVAIAAARFSEQKSSSSEIGKQKSPDRRSSNDRSTARTRKGTKTTLGNDDFQNAWEAVASRKLEKRDRRALQKQILAKWAEVDLQGALDAAMKESWDGGGVNIAGTYYFPNPLLEAFSQTFSDRPLDAWTLIQSGRYGVASQLIRNQWLASVAKTDGLLVASMLTSLPASLQPEALEQIIESAKTGPQREALLTKIIDQAGDSHPDWIQMAFKSLPDGGDPDELRGRWSTLPAGTARKIAMTEWAASVSALDPDKLTSELQNVPPDARAEATQAMLAQLKGASPALLTALDSAISSGQLDAVAKMSPSLIAEFSDANLVPPEQLAGWACNLPESPSTVEMFHKAVGRYIRDDLPRAKEWLEAMPEGSWQRENGLAEFSQQALWRKNDPKSSQWALDTITNPTIRAAAGKWRNDWETQTGHASH